jgi:DnaJ-class molecular chaperone
MKHLYRIILALALYIGVIYLLGFSQKPADVEAPASDPAETNPQDAAGQVQRSTEQDQLQAIQTDERIRELEASSKEQQMFGAAARDMAASREVARTATTPAWTQVISANREKYSELLAKARQSPPGQVECTICDGFSYMPCVMCTDHNGKCIRCEGSGHLSPDVYCPTCVGKGKCYLCNGSGKMFCPFCHDGMIDINWPPPTQSPP